MAQGPNGSFKARRIAFGGVLGALAMLFLLGAGFLPVATFTGPIFASLCLIPLICEFGAKTALLAYAAISVLAFLLVPDREVSFFFLFLTGYYPILQPQIARLHSKILRIILKIGLFLAAVAAVYSILLFLFTSPELAAELSARAPWFWAVLAGAGSLTFLLYDVLIDKIRFLYLHRFRKYFFK